MPDPFLNVAINSQIRAGSITDQVPCVAQKSGKYACYFFFTLAFSGMEVKSFEISRFRDASIFADLRSLRATRLRYEGSTPTKISEWINGASLRAPESGPSPLLGMWLFEPDRANSHIPIMPAGSTGRCNTL
jgi:hypothetical protein